MADLSWLSVEDLKALRDGDLSRVSEDGLRRLSQQQAKPQPEAKALSVIPNSVEDVGATLRGIPRQIGLTARYAIEGAPQIADVLASPFRVGQELLTGKKLQTAGGEGGLGSQLADFVGLPKPSSAAERVVGDASRAVAGGGSMSAAARGGAQATDGVLRKTLESLAARPGVQTAGAAGAGAAGGSVREAGGGPLEQFMASVLGGVAAGSGAAGASNMAQRVGSVLKPQASNAAADQQIALILERSGIDWAQVPERVRQSMRAEVAQAMQTGGPLNADALRRLLVFRSTGTTPTVGMLTQDPGQITREMNLAKTGANSIDPALQRLPSLQNQNMSALLRQLDEAGAAKAPDAMGAGRSAVASLRGREASARSNIDSLYERARDSAGRSLPLEGGTFTARANALLDEANVGSFLPRDIANKMNAIAEGKYPLTVDVAEQLKTSIGNLQRGSSDGNARRALGLVRQALDDAPLQNGGKANSTLPAVPGTVPPSVSAGEESINAFNAARLANRQWMQRVESNPALKAAVDGIEPDQFVSRFVVGRGASAKDVASLRAELTPNAAQDIKDHLVRHLRDAATNSTDDITKFSNDAYRRALRDIGEDKLRVFFSKEELQKLRDVGEAAKYMQAQPAGSAVNNSNSGALVLGRGLDMLERAAGYIPLGGRDILKGAIQRSQQTQVMNPLNALLLPQPRQSVAAPSLLGAAIVSPAEDPRKDKRGY